jgi:hypothetical protein
VFDQELWRVQWGAEMRLRSMQMAVKFALNHRNQNNPDAQIILLHNGKAEVIESENDAFYAYLKMS